MASMMPFDRAIGLHDFLREYPKMAVRPTDVPELNIEGQFEFTASKGKHPQITDSYVLQIQVPSYFPRELPIIFELQDRIPKDGSYHKNEDESLCLGSRIRLLINLARVPTLMGFAEHCLVPYLYAASHKLTYGGNFPFGELDHGPVGELTDYAELFGLETAEQARIAVRYLGMRERTANKLPCTCGCGRRLGRCVFNQKIKEYRKLAKRSWFRSM
jgi:hypothetical protein